MSQNKKNADQKVPPQYKRIYGPKKTVSGCKININSKVEGLKMARRRRFKAFSGESAIEGVFSQSQIAVSVKGNLGFYYHTWLRETLQIIYRVNDPAIRSLAY